MPAEIQTDGQAGRYGKDNRRFSRFSPKSLKILSVQWVAGGLKILIFTFQVGSMPVPLAARSKACRNPAEGMYARLLWVLRAVR
jgi:hypothetical protein